MLHKKQIISIAAVVVLIALVFLGNKVSSDMILSDLSSESIIPRPALIVPEGNFFTLDGRTDIFINDGNEEVRQIAEFLSEIINPATGFDLSVKTSNDKPKNGNIYLTLSAEKAGRESYKLDITKNNVTISADSPAGLFMGVQTLRQLLPARIEKKTKQEGPWKIATGTISDNPVYSYRGVMLDVARHFFEVKDVKRFIDLISCYKINVLHLHLSDDQGWRIEIKSWPDLTKHGGSTEVEGGKGGYYTQEDYAEIVNYARSRYITIVPEIDMPGHTNAALSSYAELNCDGKATELYTGIKVGFSTLCTNKEITYKFIDDVVREISAMTPGPIFHMGGDESHVTKKEDYIPFVDRVQEIIIKNGKQVMGWDDISIGTLRSNSIAQYWSNAKNASAAARQGAKIIFSPAKKAYLDMKYDKTTKSGQSWAAYIEVDTAYMWEPTRLVPGINREDILGIEAPLWTETLSNMEEIEYMLFPRLPGYAEIGWTAPSLRNWDEYKARLAKQGERFEAMGINYYKSNRVPWEKK